MIRHWLGDSCNLRDIKKALNNKSPTGNSVKLHINARTFMMHEFQLLYSKNFFSQRVINQWNDLPASIINSTSVLEFEKEYDRHMMSDNTFIVS